MGNSAGAVSCSLIADALLLLLLFTLSFKLVVHVAQVEVPGGRGKPSIIVDKDESLQKVIYVLAQYPCILKFCHCLYKLFSALHAFVYKFTYSHDYSRFGFP